MNRRALLVPYPIINFIIGCSYLMGQSLRTSTPSFTIVKQIGPVHSWGWMFVLGAVLMTVADCMSNRKLISATLFVGGVIWTFWSVLFLIAAFQYENASLNAWAILALVAYSHYLTAWRMWIPSNVRGAIP